MESKISISKGKNRKPFYIEEQKPEDGFERPTFHITRSKIGPANDIKAGSTIWLFSVLKSPWGNLLPSLDAKIEIEKTERLPDGRIKFHATENSKWFPLFNATKIIKNLKTIDKKGNKTKLWSDTQKPIGLYLQSIRKLSDINELTEYSENILNPGFDFISYRIKDGTKKAFCTVQKLMLNGHTVFWDRHSLPRRLVERREYVENEILDKYLLAKIHSCNCVYAIQTPEYSEEGTYAQKEALLAISLNKYKKVE